MFGKNNYILQEAKPLGEGATSVVYEGFNVKNGERVAVKTFKNILRSIDIDKEVELWMKLDHVNIVKVLSAENQTDGLRQSKAIVMELCTGGSLLDILMQLQNCCGLEDKEYLLFLKHLRDGLEYLRQQNVAHRDVKPGNIMKYIRSDGTSVYKLTDFGAARVLEENQPFQSIVGTPHYCAPEMFEMGILKTSNKPCTSKIDLWSIGVTLYHVATGKLPFQPHPQSMNKTQTLHHIISKKGEGVVSGVEKTPNSKSIQYDSKLPENCFMSNALKEIITPLIAGLLETNQRKIWDFSTFFTEVSKIVAMQPCCIFNTMQPNVVKFYVTSENFENEVLKRTAIAKNNQLFLQNSKLITSLNQIAQDESCPVFLFNKDDNKIEKAHFPDYCNKPNAWTIREYLSHKKLIDQFILNCALINKSVNSFIEFINSEYTNLNQTMINIQEKSYMLLHSMEILETKESLKNLEQFRSTYRRFVEQTLKSLKSLHEKYVINNELKVNWEEKSAVIQLLPVTLSGISAQTEDYIQNITRCFTVEHNNNKYEINRFEVINKKFLKLLSHKLIPVYVELCEFFADWYKYSQIALMKKEIIAKDINNFVCTLTKYFDKHVKIVQEYKEGTRSTQTDCVNDDFTVIEKNADCIVLDNALLTQLLNGRKEILSLCTQNTQQLLSLMKTIGDMYNFDT